jgi:hypothetical protein
MLRTSQSNVVHNRCVAYLDLAAKQFRATFFHHTTAVCPGLSHHLRPVFPIAAVKGGAIDITAAVTGCIPQE